MRLFLINRPSLKSLKLVYAPDSITVSGIVDVPASTVVHLDEPAAVPEIVKDTVVPEQSFAAAAPTTAPESAASTEERAFTHTIAFADLKALPGFADHAQALVTVNAVSGAPVVLESFSKSYRTKDVRSALPDNHFSLMQIAVPVKTVQSFDDCALFVTCDPAAFEFDGPAPVVVAPGGGRAHYAQLSIAGPDNVVAAGTPFTVTYAWPDGTPIPSAEVWSDSTAGYVNRKRAVTDAKGQATFTVVPLALDKGEQFRLKFGFRNYTGKADKLLTVS